MTYFKRLNCYLSDFVFEIDNTPFQKHAKYFRDALVLDNAKLVNKRSDFLIAFFENLLLNGQNDLSSERMYEELGIVE
ncbi:TPA: valyl-tRNA synthetase [Streptococcus suis]|nr:valyl-tRNA synthetase [Streptococcus suis]HEL1782208.1 valyl-tRNA synthetase [Streptococcus suis]HEL1798014.1 valyl-tRNA synthetase [Streptococcus suis]HEL1943188.1 valyl-tRNA synthetase [Streptococcus suis]HEL1992663.1 valyl-tRNA synthetase [Streptococcus suis]